MAIQNKVTILIGFSLKKSKVIADEGCNFNDIKIEIYSLNIDGKESVFHPQQDYIKTSRKCRLSNVLLILCGDN